MGRPRLHDETTRSELLAAAEVLLAEGGVEALSVRRLADAAGVAARAIYSVFGGKDGLLRALFSRAFHELSASIDALPLTDDPASDLVAAGALGFRGWALAHPALFGLAFAAAAPREQMIDSYSEAGGQALERLMARVQRCVDAGVLRPGAQVEVGLSFHAMCEGMASLEARGGFPLLAGRDPAAAWESALWSVVDGYRP